MRTRELGRTGRQVSIVGLGCWQLGGDWGHVDEADAMGVLHAAVDAGVTFFDTADVYGDGRSEILIGRLLAERPDAALTVATKRREGCEVLGPGGGFFGPDDVCQRGDGHLLASHLYPQGGARQVLVAVGPTRHEADVELTKLAGEVPDANVGKGCSVVPARAVPGSPG